MSPEGEYKTDCLDNDDALIDHLAAVHSVKVEEQDGDQNNGEMNSKFQ
jgi:hypothetical protein